MNPFVLLLDRDREKNHQRVDGNALVPAQHAGRQV
jgi:hypothetical protein